jgi:hypothetical protein
MATADFSQLAPRLDQAAKNMPTAIERTFNETIRRARPRFRDAARAAAGPDRVLSRHRSKTPLDAEMKILKRRKTILVVNAKGPWGIRDSTDAGSSRTAAHVITPKQKKMLKFAVDGTAVYARRVNHPGSRRQPYWAKGRKAALDVIQTRLPVEVLEAINAAINARPYKSR